MGKNLVRFDVERPFLFEFNETAEYVFKKTKLSTPPSQNKNPFPLYIHLPQHLPQLHMENPTNLEEYK